MSRKRSERTFWLALSLAALVHAGLIFEISRASPRIRGEQNGAPDSLTVELVDAAQLRSKSTMPLRAEAAPADAASPAESSPTPADALVAAPPQPDERKITEQPIDKKALEAVSPPDQAPKQSEAARKPKDKPAPEQKHSSLQLDMPADFMGPSGSGRFTAATRPPDITRSGENDEFGRGVIRALRQTMPGPRGETGRVTVRLLLSETGNLAELLLIRGANDPVLTQSVVFAVRQSSFPIPPVGSTPSDRTFLVTYVYN
jgi:periplasmic protein TonB